MIGLEYIAAPLIGGLIGLITNGIAIKMLFRPLHPVKIGKVTLPFTPGLIPKEKNRIARAIGQTVGGSLLDAETLQRALVSDNLRKALDKKVDTVIEKLGCEEGTVGEYLESKGFLETIDQTVDTFENRVSGYLASYLVEQKLGDEILDVAMKKILENLNSMVALVAEPALEKARPGIAKKIDEMIIEECPGIVKGYMNQEYDRWMDRPMKEVAIYLWQKKEFIKEKIWEVYVSVLNEKSERLFQRLDVAAIVEEKVNEFDPIYLEKLIMDISRKELNALVWIGGLLGMMLGFVNLLF
ncbi:MAG: DUF445 family protein [Eubacteriales bacterium]|nr:DUF445 family protein [Eubacteriales bacterium]